MWSAIKSLAGGATSAVTGLSVGIWLKLAAVAIAAILLWLAYLWAYDRGVMSQSATITQLNSTIQSMDIAARSADATYRAQEATWRDRIGQIQVEHAKELASDQAIENSLRADVDAGKRQLRIRAICPNGDGHTAALASGSGGSDDPGVELSGPARLAYFKLRAAIELDRRTIRACQSYVTSIGGAP